MVAFVNPDTIQRPSTGSLVPASLLDQYNDNDNFLYGDTAWTAASGYTNGWGVYSGVVGFRKIGTKVELRGLISAGTIGNPAFTLPAGYRPSQNCNVATVANGLFGYLIVFTTGVVTPQAGSTTWFSLDNISFDTI